jgi:hypothetical protein
MNGEIEEEREKPEENTLIDNQHHSAVASACFSFSRLAFWN